MLFQRNVLICLHLGVFIVILNLQLVDLALTANIFLFSCNYKDKVLDLDSRNIERIKNVVKSTCPISKNLQRINFNYNFLSIFSNKEFQNLPNLKYISLKSNGFENIGENIFVDNKNLEEIIFYDNNLKNLPENLFRGLTKLKKLNVANNRLQTLPNEIFKNLFQLKEIDLHSNKLSRLPSNVFRGLKNLNTLRLNNNKMTDLPNDIFSDLIGLKSLYLHKNDLMHLDDNILKNCMKLEIVDLQQNPIAQTTFHLKVSAISFEMEKYNCRFFGINFRLDGDYNSKKCKTSLNKALNNDINLAVLFTCLSIWMALILTL